MVGYLLAPTRSSRSRLVRPFVRPSHFFEIFSLDALDCYSYTVSHAVSYAVRRFKKAQEGSGRLNKAQEGIRKLRQLMKWFKKVQENQMVQEGFKKRLQKVLRRFKTVQEG